MGLAHILTAVSTEQSPKTTRLLLQSQDQHLDVGESSPSRDEDSGSPPPNTGAIQMYQLCQQRTLDRNLLLQWLMVAEDEQETWVWAQAWQAENTT
ncbi:hypothetical protein Y1Q_0001949 [Alligator mississippiensis]|uniref:Uncharacterized protein n=1 Tax=Alligator mississippiensis TaxID=8496 RepID=A0A151PGC2_ALLMI|nr:hypothetical protein Y1Q_0001949 [Alligator mississippiensis]